MDAEKEVLKKELADLTWACQKTNDGIRILYADLERKNLELQKLDKLRSKLISTVSHELRTPLTAIIMGIDNLCSGVFGALTEKQRAWLSRINESAEHLAGLLNEILDLSKLESGKESESPERFDLNDLVRRAMEQIRIVAEKKEVSLILEERSASSPIWGSPQQVFRVMTNLMSNALKFTPAGGRVMVSMEDQEACVRVAVADTGPGIPADDLQKIFDPFVQSPGDRPEDNPNGIGLGLTICREIVDLHKGRIWAESEVGKGSVFIMTLPKGTGKAGEVEVTHELSQF